TDRDEHGAVLLVDGAQLVQHVEAVDAAERPEVQQHDLAAQVLEGEVLAAGVDPAAAGQLRCAQADAVAGRAGGCGCCGRCGDVGSLDLGGGVLLSGHAGDSPIWARPCGAHASHGGTSAMPLVFPGCSCARGREPVGPSPPGLWDNHPMTDPADPASPAPIDPQDAQSIRERLSRAAEAVRSASESAHGTPDAVRIM